MEGADRGGQLPTKLLEDEEYLSDLFAEPNAADAAALEVATLSEEAGNDAEGYVQTTLFFAMALFFAGIATSFSSRPAQIMPLSASCITLVVASVLSATYPIA